MNIDTYIPYSNGGFYYQSLDKDEFIYSNDVEILQNKKTLSFSSNGILAKGNEFLNDASDIIKLYGINRPEIYNRDLSFIRKFNKIHNKIQAFKKTYIDFGVNLNSLKIEFCIPEAILNEFLECRIEFLKLFISYCKDLDLSYYNDFFKRANYATSNFQEIAFNKEKLSYALLLNKGVQASTKKMFLKKDKDTTEPLKMNMFGTRTGRLSVESGIDILHLPKNYRNIMRSKFDGGEIHVLDYNAMEIRVAAFLIENFEVVETSDLHRYFANKVFGSEDKRDLFKKMFFPVFYGSSINKVSGICDITISEATRATNKIKNIFPFHKVIELVKILGNDKPYIENCFGRPVFLDDRNTPDYKLVNYFIQSSAADLALQSLYSVVKYIKDNKLKSGPIYIHHDAIAIDVHPSERKHIENIKNIMENENKFGVKFPVSSELL